EAQSTRSAPPAASVVIKCAVSLVTCRQAETRMPLRGFCFAKRALMSASTGIERPAHSMRPRPFSARRRSFTWCGVFILATAMGFLADRGRALVHQIRSGINQDRSAAPPEVQHERRLGPRGAAQE